MLTITLTTGQSITTSTYSVVTDGGVPTVVHDSGSVPLSEVQSVELA